MHHSSSIKAGHHAQLLSRFRFVPVRLCMSCKLMCTLSRHVTLKPLIIDDYFLTAAASAAAMLRKHHLFSCNYADLFTCPTSFSAHAKPGSQSLPHHASRMKCSKVCESWRSSLVLKSYYQLANTVRV